MGTWLTFGSGFDTGIILGFSAGIDGLFLGAEEVLSD